MEDVLLECQVCFERYDTDSRRPKILSCGHTFCLSCLCASDNKCSNCRILFKGSPMNLPDNFILLSAADNAPPPKKKAFWCLDCKKGADAECEDSHTICSMKKIVSEQMGDVSESVQEQLGKEEAVLARLLVKLEPVKVAIRNGLSTSADLEMNAHSVAKDEINKIIQSIPEIENNPNEDSLDALKSHLAKSLDRLPTLEKKFLLLDMLQDCDITVKPSSNSDIEWTFKMNMSGEDVSDELRGLYYLIFKEIGRQNFEFPEYVALPHSADSVVPIPRTVTPSPSGTCVVQVFQSGRQLGQVTINVVETIIPPKKDLLLKGLNGIKLYPKFSGALTGSLRTDLFLPGNAVKITKGSVGIGRSPLQPLSIFVQKPFNSVPSTGMFVWGKVVENVELLESIVQNWATTKAIVVLQSPRWI